MSGAFGRIRWRLVAADGGRITLTPRPGGGVRATIWLPLADVLIHARG